MAVIDEDVQFRRAAARLRSIVPAALSDACRSPKTATNFWATCINEYSARRTCFAGNDLLQAPGRTVPAPTTCGRGGIGRRAALRSLWGNPWKFESSRPHHLSLKPAAPLAAGFDSRRHLRILSCGDVGAPSQVSGQLIPSSLHRRAGLQGDTDRQVACLLD